MPSIIVYIREAAYIKLMKECGHDPRRVKRKIADMVHEKYG